MSDWFRLPYLAAIRITGSDAIAFAHSQFTSVFDKGRSTHWEPTARCNAKGRVLELILSRVDEDHVELIAPSAQASTLARALRLYAIGRRLELQELPAVSARWEAPGTTDALRFDPARSLSLDHPDAPENGPAARLWQMADLKAGVAWLNADTAGQFLPQALGLEERGGLSFRKGCYPGQEIIARVHFLGRSKERLSAFRCAQDAGSHRDILDCAGEKQGQVISAMAGDQDFRGLAVVSSTLDSDVGLRLGAQALTLLAPEAL
ncbi:MAG: CAF17-like 4Fe-4S cluster assembly/insertion protein YgfZ [Wenzhouxiangella sp.]